MDIGFGIAVSRDSEELIATHVPIEVDTSTSPGTLRCHFAVQNPHVDAVERDENVLVIFQGPHAYISPSWFPTTKESGKMVPTWNYIVVHAYGRARTFRDTSRLLDHVNENTDRFESGFSEPWSVDNAPQDFIEGLTRAIVGVEIEIERLEGKWKLSQNHPVADRRGVASGLRERGSDHDRQLADWIDHSLEEQ